MQWKKQKKKNPKSWNLKKEHVRNRKGHHYIQWKALLAFFIQIVHDDNHSLGSSRSLVLHCAYSLTPWIHCICLQMLSLCALNINGELNFNLKICKIVFKWGQIKSSICQYQWNEMNFTSCPHKISRLFIHLTWV
jgi:hypothetical protein